MKLSVIIPTKDRCEILSRSLEAAVMATSHIDSEIIIVNDSKTSTPVIHPYKNVFLVANPKSGVASARNFGVSCSKSEWLLLMDDDFRISKESVDFTLQFMAQDTNLINLFNWSYPPEIYEKLKRHQFGRYLVAFGFDSLKGWLGNEWVPDHEVFELKSGASYFLPMTKTMFNEIGGYNETFPHAGAEDYDFIQRAKHKGVKFVLNKKCLLYHDESDKFTLASWLNRKKRTGETLKVAAELGYGALALRYSFSKRTTLAILSEMKSGIFMFLYVIPNTRMLDWIYFKMVNALLAISLYEGYRGRK